MDRAQKQLISTYFRKRKMANDNGIGAFYKVYELKNDYVLKNNLIDFEKENKRIMKLNDSFIISYMLENNPGYLDYFDFNLNLLDKTELTMLFIKQPQLIDHPKLQPYVTPSLRGMFKRTNENE
jgi:hypothetical protein